ncbi:flagellin N-terminal helical domain-containing protein [Butyrivibrio sp. XPD2006]|uniref:flagellin N-terminal helical domain-containing protein n=1 Tax=Butyrivibrio sp. XPD2006 TaxID=1280668 RepID=UPI0003B5FE06|nr:flagellin [Butyrivibrio sp. XPD2006]
MVIQHNMASAFTQLQLKTTTGVKKKSTEKLSSGYRINRAADDAAGLAISEKMRRQIRGMNQNLDNIQDGISFCQVADGYLNEIHDMVQRVSELAIKGANETLTDEDREYIDSEVQQIKKEIQNVFDGASFNEGYIFRVPYHPSVIPIVEPYETQLFYDNTGKLGGLEFNNVRYNISELNSKGMSLNSNGIATKNQDVEFDLWDGEHVRLSLQSGQSLADVKRRYDWTADDTGISVNNVPAVTWAELGVNGDGTDGGLYTFEYHGLSIGFLIADGDSMERIQAGINGNSITEPAYWELSVSSTTTRPIVKYNSGSTMVASEANESYFDHDFVISANTNGVHITDKTNGTGSSTTTNWGEFRHIGSPIGIDETGSGFPIVDWGIDNDDNGQSQITFDTLATYEYISKNSAMPIAFTYNLADVSSQNHVIDAMDETKFTGTLYSPATLVDKKTSSSIATSDGSSLAIYNKRIADSGKVGFGLQRGYGRNFDTNEALSGKITWTIEKVSGEETEHEHTNSKTAFVDYDTPPTVTNQGTFYYYDAESDGYYKFDMTETTSIGNMKTTDTYEWKQTYKVKYDGTLGTANMKDKTEQVVVSLSQEGDTTFKRTNVTYRYENETLLSDEEVAELLDAGTTFETQFKMNTSVESDWDTVDGDVTVKDGLLTHRQNFVAENEGNANNYAFSFYHDISHYQIVHSSGGSADLGLSFDGDATRSFTPVASKKTIDEHDFMNIEIIAPKKSMVIQASPNSPIDEQIELLWDCLTLNSLSMAGTNTLSASMSRAAIEQTKKGLQVISEQRGIFGASQNKLEHAYNDVGNTLENTQAAESLIRDTDMAKEYSKLSAHNILEQAGQAMLAQANQSTNGVLSLLQ